MAKKHRKPVAPLAAPGAGIPVESISSRGKTAIAIGIAGLAVGFIVLSYADALGRNWAAKAAPFLILASYGLIGIGIFLPADDSQNTQYTAFTDAPKVSSNPGKTP